jgi:hypothetical protein
VWGAKPNTEPHSNSDGDSHRDYYGNTDCYSNTYRNANRDGYSECDSDTYSHAGRVCFRTWLLEEPWPVAGKSIAAWQPHL